MSDPVREPGSGEKAPLRLRAEEVRRRERRRRRRGPLWDALSILFHAAIVALLAWFTPLREIVIPQRRPSDPRDIAREMPPERVAEVAERIEEARVAELQQQLQDMQRVLQNMEVMRDAMEEDYDHFAESQEDPVRDELADAIDEVADRQTSATNRLESLVERLEQVARNAAENRLNETNSAEWAEARDLANEIEARFAEVADDQGNAVNDLDRARMLASFAGFERTSTAADSLRERQMASARETASAGMDLVRQATNLRDLAPTLAELAAQREKAERAEPERAAAERERSEHAAARDDRNERMNAAQQAENRSRGEARDARNKANGERDQARRERDQARGDKDRARREHEEARRENAQADRDEQRARQEREQATRLRQNGKENEAARHEQAASAADASAARHRESAASHERAAEERERSAAAHEERAAAHDEAAKQSDAAARAADEAATAAHREFDRMRGERDAEQRSFQTAERRLWDLQRTVSGARDRVRELERRRDELRAAVTGSAARSQRQRAERALAEQARLRAETDRLRETLRTDVAKPTPLQDGDPERSELAEVDVSAMSLPEAYDMALRLEGAITETYKDVRAASTAIERRVPFSEAQRLTDVPLPVHPEPDFAAIESQPGTKEELDRRAAAQSELVRETGEMADSSVSMMNDAYAILFPEGGNDAVKREGSRWDIRRLTPEMLSGRDGGASSRLDRMYAMATLAQSSAESAKATGWHKGAQMGGRPSVGGANLREQYRRDATASPEGRHGPVSTRPNTGRRGMGKDLLPGSSLRTVSDSGDGVPGSWMYLNSWYVIGPFPNPNRVNVTRKFPPESVVDLNATYVGRDGETVRWVFTQARSVSPLNPGWSFRRAEVVPRNATEFGIWYGYTEVRVDHDCWLWLAVGSDDRSDMWVNGVQVWGSVNERKEWHIDESVSKEPIFFHAGVNAVLFRLENGPGPTGFSVCLSPAEEPPPL